MGATDIQIAQAFSCFQRGDLAAAEGLLVALPEKPSALHLMGVLRVRQGRMREAAEYLSKSVALQPGEAQAQFNYAKVLAALGRTDEAKRALEAALACEPDHAEAAQALARLLHEQRHFADAVIAWRAFLALRPADGAARLALGGALFADGQETQATIELERALEDTSDPRLRADLHQALALTLRRRPAEALAHLEKAQRLDPARSMLDRDRAALLEEQQRFAEARALYETMLAREPGNVRAQEAYSDLLYRMGDDEAFLSSCNLTAPASRTSEILLQKGRFLLSAKRGAEAEALYRGLLESNPEESEAALGLGLALLAQGAMAEAVASLEAAAEKRPEAADIWCNLSGALIRWGDIQKAEAMASRSLMLEPHNQVAIATLGTCWRLMGDPRDEWLNRYDEFVRIFDLAPPDGFASMEAFNDALNASLDGLHPPVREYPRQSLRGGTQTSANLFGAGHPLVERLRHRIAEAVTRYAAGLERRHDHPLLARATQNWAFAGSWSSRLRDQGFHINHVHPGGWISSCYYVALPPAVGDGDGRQGWITFGAPSFETGLAPRRMVQPRSGRLVLFPSYMWHGTTPFRDAQSRTTIAFDVVPA
jgi:tetratricopeptide (TPR) repeat protein